MFVQAAFGRPNPYAGKQSATETRSGGMPGDPGAVGRILVVDDDAMVRQTITNYLGARPDRHRDWPIVSG